MIPAVYIKRDIEFNKNFRSLLEVLKLVAVSQYHTLEEKLRTFPELGGALAGFFDSIDLGGVRHPFLDPGDAPAGVVAVTSDAGLLGGMNMQIISKAAELVREANGRLVVVGERGQAFAKGLKIPFTYFPGILDAERRRQSAELRDYLVEEILTGKMGPLQVVYCRAVSLVVQRLEVEALEPFVKRSQEIPSADQIFESTPERIVEYLVCLFLGQRLYEIFGINRVAEQAARFVHLEESSEKISGLNRKLLLQYFRRRHEIIDQNMRELFAARSIYAK